MLTPNVTPITIGTAHPSSPERSSGGLLEGGGMTCADARHLLERLLAEGSTTLATDLVHHVIYSDDLDAARAAYVGLVVTEIATFGGEPFGRQVG